MNLTWFEKGQSFYASDNYNEAIESYARAIELDASLAAAYNGRGDAYASLGDTQQAIKDYDKAIERDPEDVVAYYNRGTVYSDIGDTKQAIKDLKICAKLGNKEAQDILRSNKIEW
jgi:tetratricopeptide (TPR) repeat protein